MFGVAVFQANGLGHFCHHMDFLACAVDKLELAFWEHNGQRDARESAAGTEVQNGGSCFEAQALGNGQRVQYVVFVEVLDVFPGNDINFLVPVLV